MHSDNQENINSIKNENFKGDELAAIVEEYPYYAPAQFWLLSDYKKNQHTYFDKQASLTALFFNNSKWLSWQLWYQNKIEDKYPRAGEPVSPIAEPGGEKQVENIPIAENKDEVAIAFEPLYTVDYFASQGIRISNEALANDKLGTQLKSFTDWLKSMKKIHSEKIPGGDEQTDKIIRHIAENSNNSINVVTEAMAEVLLKQGKVEQAIEMYNKLSLNYPSRSAYFADKIKSLKPA